MVAICEARAHTSSMTGSTRDTICALATGAPPTAIAIIRISGPAVSDVVAAHLGCGLATPRLATLTQVLDADGKAIDVGLATRFVAPNSYTGEDLLELSVHGGQAVIEDLLSTLTGMDGVRLAEPGEFTRRAFEAGKLDLTEAEAVADLIDAATQAQRQQALQQLGGGLKETYQRWRDLLLETLALVEVAVDFPDEEDAPDHTDDAVLERIQQIKSELGQSLDDDAIGERIRDGFRIVLIGAPNAGKSSLLNQLAGRPAAIVTDVPGTTRDIVEVQLKIAGHLAIIMDTAGLRESDDPVEAEGIRRTKAAAKAADLRVIVVDGSTSDMSLASHATANDIIALNKSDLFPTATSDVSRETLAISAKTGDGIDGLIDAIGKRLVARVTTAPAPLITRARHRAGLQAALHSITNSERALTDGIGPELVAEDIRSAVRSLSSLMGTINVEDVLGAVFSEFCIGK